MPSGGVQTPQLALQQTMPVAQVARPHGTPAASPPVASASGTQFAWPSRASQRVFVAHMTAAHGCMPVTHVGTGSQGARTHCTVWSSQWASSGQT